MTGKEASVPAQQPPSRVVGIGASAGGVEAFTRLLKALPGDTGLAFLFLPHLSPDHPSQLAELLGRVAAFPMTEARDGEGLLPDHGYLLPSNRALRIEGTSLRLEPRPARDGPPTAIDDCFASLAQEYGSNAVGVILSGTGSDGAAGLLAIKTSGGLTYAQDFATAAYPSMPRSAVEAGGVDITLPPEDIARSIADLARVGRPGPVPEGETDQPAPGRPGSELELSALDALALDQIIATLQRATGVDFRHYKRSSLARRIQRRVNELGLPDLAAYARLVRDDAVESHLLFASILIHVTAFFREPATFEVLQSVVIPALIAERPAATQLRVWVVGCATGEEAYSVAMAFLEAETRLQRDIPVKVFASDVSQEVIAVARLGRYSEEIQEDVSSDRLRRFFQNVERGFQVDKRLREMCVFAQHDITRDPPFANIDLVICRNLLIYLEPVLQRRTLEALHYALRPGGFLALGAAESVAGQETLFSPLDRKNKIFLRRNVASRLRLDAAWRRDEQGPGGQFRSSAGLPPVPWSSAELQQAAALAFFAQSPAGSVLVNPDLEVRHFQGRTTPYLQPPTGGPTTNLLRMAHPDLRLVLGRLVRRVQKENRAAHRRNVRLKVGTRTEQVNVSVYPVSTDETERDHYLVVFDSLRGGARVAGEGSDGGEAASGDDRRSLELEQELVETREYLQAIIEQQDESHAELQAAYESSLSANEEFQSTNEELESTKEELQSVNEELTTVNEQLQQRNAELGVRTSEMSGLLESMDMPILLLTPDLRLRAFNARAAGELRLARTQLGRPIFETQSPLPLHDLRELVDRALEAAAVQERELRGREGQWYALRIWPVVPDGGQPSAVVAALVDIGHVKQELRLASEGEAFQTAVFQAVREPLVVLTPDLRVVGANRSFLQMIDSSEDSIVGIPLSELAAGAWNIPELQGLLEETSRTGAAFEDYQVTIPEEGGPGHTFLLNGRLILEPGEGARNVLLALVDVTQERVLQEQMVEAGRMQAVGQLAGGVAHEINNQMTTVLGFADLLSRSSGLTVADRADVDQILRGAHRAAEITGQLLAFSRRKISTPTVTDLNALVAASEGLLLRTLGEEIGLDLRLGEEVGQVRLDQGEFEQILVNLASNARDAMAPGGRFTIETAGTVVGEDDPASSEGARLPRGRYARLIARDTGAGMSEATRSHVFEPFFTTKPVGLGTGLGLASVYGTVKQAGGFIWVESEEGRGTTFTIDFPRAAASEPAKLPLPPATIARGSETILVVEDDGAVREWISRALAELGFVVLQAKDGHEGLRMVRGQGEAIALVVSDVVMPGMGGTELSRRLGALRPGLPVVLISAYSREELSVRGIVGPDVPVLAKPFRIGELAGRIRGLLDQATESASDRAREA